MNANKTGKARCICIHACAILIFLIPFPLISKIQARTFTTFVPEWQERTIRGEVKDSNNSPVPGVTIRVKDASGSAKTDAEGKFSIKVNGEANILVFSYVGFIPQEVRITTETEINVVLKDDQQTLEDVVVLGFGQVQKKIAQTGSTASISSKELLQSPVANITNALAGRLPGLIAVQRSGEPGQDASTLYIRGVATMNSQSPLVTIDGIQKDYSAINTLDPNEIEDITILKDASATALYGVKGANGVIIVTTRRGKTGTPTISMSTSTAIQSPANLPEFLDSYQWATLYNEAFRNDNPTLSTVPYSDAALEAFRTGSDPYRYPNVNWLDETLKSSYQTLANFNISGGTKQVRYFVNVGYTGQDGLFKTEKQKQYDPKLKYNRYNFRSNVDIDFNENFSLGLNLFGGIENRDRPSQPTATIFSFITATPPLAFPVKFPTGLYGGGTSSGIPVKVNPLWRINNLGYSEEFNSSLSGMLAANHKLNFITQGLSAKMNFSFDGYFINTLTRTAQTRTAIYKGTGDLENPNSYTYAQQDIPLSAPSATFTQNRDTWLDFSLNYDRVFNDHQFTGLLLANRQQQVRAGAIPFVSQGLVGRVAYNFKNTYFAEFNAGYSGTDNFAKENRYGFFPAISAAWVALRDKPVIELLKIRGSTGLTGNDQLNGRRWLFVSEYLTGGTYAFGETLASVPGYQEGPMANPAVTWEKSHRSNIGIELNLFKQGLLTLISDYFYEKRTDILVTSSQIPDIVGVSAANLPPGNFGSTKNQGFEIELGHRYRMGNVNYFVRGNMSFARNKILEQEEVTRLYPNLIRTGHPIGQNFNLEAIGFFRDQADITNSPTQTFGPVIPGDIKYRDVNMDGQIDVNDVTAVGYSSIPEIMYGISAGINWKGLDFSFLFQGAANFSMSRQLELAYEFYQFGNVMTEHLGRWTPETAETATYPVLHTGVNPNNHRSGAGSSFYLKNASYLRLKNAEIGYTFKGIKLTKSVGLSSLRLYSNALNLLTWHSVGSGIDPESPSGRNATYPQVKIFNFGISTKF
jgi:TonB-linked SusC/RagA family outer membrane protein